MTRRRALQIAGGVVLLIALGWGVMQGLTYVVTPRVVPGEAPGAAEVREGVPHITATLYYADATGAGLVSVQREVPLADDTVAQGRAIVNAQLAPPPSPYVSVVPKGTTLRAFYLTERRDAFVDLSREASANHPGGSFTELMTVYAIVNAVTTNLPAVLRVQILVDGREADTLAGHVDLRRPLQADLSLVKETGAQ
jgi:spore germination protein GerM